MSPSAGVRSVTLIDPFATGHHTPYAVMLCRQLRERGLSVRLIGTARLVEAVNRQVPLDDSAVLELYQGSKEAYYARGKWHEERSSYLFARRALEQARAWNSDVAHFIFLDSFIMSLLAARPSAGRMRVYTTLHWAYLLPRFRGPGLAGRLRADAQCWGLRQLLRTGVRLQVHSASFVPELERRTVPGQVSYIPHPTEAPDEAAWERVPALRRELKLSPDMKLLLAFGGTRRNKGADVAVAALAHLPEHYHLMVVGAEEYFTADALTALAERLGVRHRVHLRLQYVPPEDCDLYFAAASAALLPYTSSFSGQSGVLFSAGAMGILVVSSDAGTMSELIGQFGLGEVYRNAGPADEVGLRLAQAVQAAVERPDPPETVQARRLAFMNAHSLRSFTDNMLRDYGSESPG